MGILQIFILIILVLVLGVALGRITSKLFYAYEARQAEYKAQAIVKEAKVIAAKIKKDKVVEAKEKFSRLKAALEHDSSKRQEQLAKEEDQMRRKEEEVTQQLEQLHRKEVALAKAREELAHFKAKKAQELEKIAHFSTAQAKEKLLEILKDEARSKAATRIRTIVEEAKANATQEAQKVILTTIQRTVAEQTIENSSCIVDIGNDAIKGKIIGREGRNIRALEAATGVDIVIDEHPETILISSFNPVRREIARLAIQQLIQDGRIHPARIEEIVEKVGTRIEKEIVHIGERTVIELGIYGVNVALIKLIGKMRYRASYGQNLLQHSREVARLAATMAAEMGVDSKLAKRAGLLHDIGKVADEASELSHALLGMELATRYREHPEVCNAIGAHHNEIEMTSTISPIVQACDAISGARPGVRREVSTAYAQRLHDMEDIALSFSGVKKCYAIQAGRELRVIVDADHVTDAKANQLAFDISSKIEQQIQYPGHVKVMVIRELRAVHYAK